MPALDESRPRASGAPAAREAAREAARRQRGLLERRVQPDEVSTCFPGEGCVRAVSAARCASAFLLWGALVWALEDLRQKRRAAGPPWAAALLTGAACAALLVHAARFRCAAGPCGRPNYCLAASAFPLLLWSGCSPCDSLGEAVEVYHGRAADL